MVGSLFLLFSALSLLLGILALCGKGGWLVAGFFGTKQAKESFDRTKAYRIIGIMNFVESVCFAVFAYFAFFRFPSFLLKVIRCCCWGLPSQCIS